MVFVPDPLETEAVGWPSFHIQAIREEGNTGGDCDDAAALAGALARSVGRPVRLIVASFRPDRKLHHIWAEGWAGEAGWVELDPFRAERFEGRPTRRHSVMV